MLTETIVRKQMAHFRLSCTVLYNGPGWALNMYSRIRGLFLKPLSFSLGSDSLESFLFYASRGKDVSMLVDVILGTYMFYPLVLYDVGVSPFYYATVKRPTSSPFTHLYMCITTGVFGVKYQILVIPTLVNHDEEQ